MIDKELVEAMWYNSLSDEIYDIKSMIRKALKPFDEAPDRELELIVLTNQQCHDILNKLEAIEDEYNDNANDLESARDDISDLEVRVDELEAVYNGVPEDVADLFPTDRYDLGTVLALKEATERVLKEHGYA